MNPEDLKPRIKLYNRHANWAWWLCFGGGRCGGRCGGGWTPGQAYYSWKKELHT